MLPLSCLHCGKNLKVKDDLAGKRVRCPHCKQTLDIPARLPEDATVPPSDSRSLENRATIPPSWSPSPSPSPSPPPDDEPAHETVETRTNGSVEATQALAAAAHYQVGGEIARGGMGAIMRAVDQDIRR